MSELIIGSLKAVLPQQKDADQGSDGVIYLDVISDGVLGDVPEVISLPDMSLDLTPYRIELGDGIEYIEKHEGWQKALETWSANLKIYSDLLNYYIAQAKEVPDEVKKCLDEAIVQATALSAGMGAIAKDIKYQYDEVIQLKSELSSLIDEEKQNATAGVDQAKQVALLAIQQAKEDALTEIGQGVGGGETYNFITEVG